MFKTGQHVEVTSPRLLEILARRKSQPFGTVVAVDPQAEYPVKVRITDDTGFQIPFTFDGEQYDYMIKLLGSANALWDIPPYGIITDRKQPHRKTGIAKARREAKKRRNRK